jgi:hypothetical protein
MIDLMAIAAIDRETEVSYIRRERDWATRAAAEGRFVDSSRMLPVLPATIAGLPGANGNGHRSGASGNGHGQHGGSAVTHAPHE